MLGLISVFKKKFIFLYLQEIGVINLLYNCMSFIAARKDTTTKNCFVWVFFNWDDGEIEHYIPHLLHVFWQYLTARSRFEQITTSTPGAEQKAG